MEPSRTEQRYPSLIPIKIVAVYAVVSCLWIFFSDAMVVAVVKDPHLMARIAILKGWVFILATSALLFILIRSYLAGFKTFNDTLALNQEQLRESERRFRELMERVHMIALMLDTRGNITFCNDFLLQLSGWSREEIMGKNWFDTFLPPNIKNQVLDVFRKGISTGDIPFYYENSILTRTGDECLIVWDNTLLRDAQGTVTGVASIGKDETKQRNMEAHLRQSQKMESIGTLAGGVAHDFNNILMVIMSCTEMLRNKLADRERALHLVEQILGSAQRAAKLTRSLLAFSRKQQILISPISLNELIAQMQELLAGVIGAEVELNTELSEEELIILADRGQIEQVVMNLVINARDSMPQGGRLTISTCASQPADHMLADGSAAAGRYALLSLADTGIGISRQDQERIFEPFFTTKEVGKGTGLGLSMAYGIVRQHNGWIHVESEVGRGSCFMVYLPLAG